MATQTLQTIKSWFVRYAKPTQQQFWDTWDSFWHKSEKIPLMQINGANELIKQVNEMNEKFVSIYPDRIESLSPNTVSEDEYFVKTLLNETATDKWSKLFDIPIDVEGKITILRSDGTDNKIDTLVFTSTYFFTTIEPDWLRYKVVSGKGGAHIEIFVKIPPGAAYEVYFRSEFSSYERVIDYIYNEMPLLDESEIEDTELIKTFWETSCDNEFVIADGEIFEVKGEDSQGNSRSLIKVDSKGYLKTRSSVYDYIQDVHYEYDSFVWKEEYWGNSFSLNHQYAGSQDIKNQTEFKVNNHGYRVLISSELYTAQDEQIFKWLNIEPYELRIGNKVQNYHGMMDEYDWFVASNYEFSVRYYNGNGGTRNLINVQSGDIHAEDNTYQTGTYTFFQANPNNLSCYGVNWNTWNAEPFFIANPDSVMAFSGGTPFFEAHTGMLSLKGKNSNTDTVYTRLFCGNNYFALYENSDDGSTVPHFEVSDYRIAGNYWNTYEGKLHNYFVAETTQFCYEPVNGGGAIYASGWGAELMADNGRDYGDGRSSVGLDVVCNEYGDNGVGIWGDFPGWMFFVDNKNNDCLITTDKFLFPVESAEPTINDIPEGKCRAWVWKDSLEHHYLIFSVNVNGILMKTSNLEII